MKKKTVLLLGMLGLALLSGCGKSEEQKALREEGIQAYQNNEYEKAEELFQAVIEDTGLFFDEVEEDSALYLADSLEKQEKYTDAIKAYNILISHKKKEAIYYNNRGNLFVKNNQIKKGIKDYKKAIELEETNLEFYLNLYTAYQLEGEEEKGEPYLAKAKKQASEKEKKSYTYGKVLLYLGEYNEASNILLNEVDKGNIEAYLYLGLCASYEEDYEQAEEYYDAYLKEDASNSFAYYQLIETLLCNEKIDDAYQLIKTAYEKGDDTYLKQIKSQEIVVLEKKCQYKKAYALAKKYVEEYKEDEKIKKELIFLETR